MEEIRQRSVDKIKYTQEQMDCLTYAGSRTLMVKGYAGSGKSLILEAIAKKYRDFYGYQRINGVMIFTYQNTLVSVVRENMELEGDVNEAIQVSTWNQYENQVYEQLIQEGKVPSVRYPYGRHAEEHRLNNVAAALELHRNRYGKHRLLDLPVKFWLAEFDWMKEKNIWINDQENYLKLPRTGRGDIVRMHMQDRIEAYGIFTTYCQYLNQTKQGDWIDRTLYLARHPELIPESRKYEHVLIDEAQDLSLVQMKAMMNVYTKDMSIAMDANQRIYGREWTPKELGIETVTKRLTKSMRTTRQIDALAESVRKNNDFILDKDDKGMRELPDRQGVLPYLIHVKDADEEKRRVIQLVKQYMEQNKKLRIGIIAARTSEKEDQLACYSSWMAEAGIYHEIVKKDSTFSARSPGVKIVSAFSSKGLEFDVVIIPHFEENYFPTPIYTDNREEKAEFLTKMRNLVYVSMTRARQMLILMYRGDHGSRFIGEMDPEEYQVLGLPIQDSYLKEESGEAWKQMAAKTPIDISALFLNR